MHTNLHLDKLQIRRDKHICIWVYKILNDQSPKKLKRFFTQVAAVCTRITRQSESELLYIQKPRLEITRRSFRYRGAILWNSLPLIVKQAGNLNELKKGLKWYFGES